MKISVNILTWNNVEVLHDTLHVLSEDLGQIDNEIIVVDNGSKDGSQDYARIKNEKNLGVSIGKNQALDISQGEYVLMLDGDIMPVPNSVPMLIDFLDNHLNIHAVGFPPNKFNAQRNKNGQKHHEDRCTLLYDPKIHTQAICFYGLFMRSELSKHNIRFTEYGTFAQEGYGWEDSDFYMQMREAGIHQWVAGMNTAIGKYYHQINSSLRQPEKGGMGQSKYRETSKQRMIDFRAKWGDKEKLYYGTR